MEILIKGARIIDCCHDFVGDLYIKDGTIEEVGKSLNKDCENIEADGYVLMPAFVDLHSHFRDPGLTYKEDIETGSKAAVHGGYTAVNLMANTKPVCSDMQTFDYVVSKAEKIGLIDVHQTVSITKDFKGSEIDHLDLLDERVKCISDDGKDVYSSKVMLQAMMKAKEKNLVVMCHAEDEELTPIDTRLSENVATFRDISLAKYAGCHAHISHVSTIEAMNYIIEAKKQGYRITCEVAPHHIALTSRISYRVNPSLREESDVQYLIKCIKDGWVDSIGTDHAPHSKEDKEKGAPGLTGLETSFSVCFTELVKAGHISLNKLSEIMSKNPAEIMKMKKGKIQLGYDGDVVLLDLDKKYKIDAQKFFSKGKNTPLDGLEFYGEVVKTIKGGKIVYSRD
ncbi:MAG: dihydroorotase [Bacillota bacterium]|nr:dihydroorotase [Bacillota bacterium]